MVANELLMQFQADILGVPVVRPRMTETTALGAAYAAGLAVGYWSNRDELATNWGVDKRWQPAMAERGTRRLYALVAEGRHALVRLDRAAVLTAHRIHKQRKETGGLSCMHFGESCSGR